MTEKKKLLSSYTVPTGNNKVFAVAGDPPTDWEVWYDRAVSEKLAAQKALRDIYSILVGPDVVPIKDRKSKILNIIKKEEDGNYEILFVPKQEDKNG